MKNGPATPELDKLRVIRERSQLCGTFLSWLYDQGFHLCTVHKHTEECGMPIAPKTRQCGLQTNQLVQTHLTIDRLLALFFDIDEAKMEQEKRLILDYLRRNGAL